MDKFNPFAIFFLLDTEMVFKIRPQNNSVTELKGP